MLIFGINMSCTSSVIKEEGVGFSSRQVREIFFFFPFLIATPAAYGCS